MPAVEQDGRRGLRAKWRGLSFEAKVTAFVAPLLVFAVTFTAERILGDRGGGDSPDTSEQSSQSGRLEVVDVRTSEADKSAAVELVVRNTGRTVSVITEAEFRVRDVIDPSNLSTCAGIIDLTGSYDVSIPASRELFGPEDGIGEVVSIDVSQEIPPNKGDRFAFDVGVAGTEANPASASKPALYLIDVAIRHDGEDTALSAGSVLLGIPLRDPGCSGWSAEDVEELRRAARGAEKSPELAELVARLLD